MKCVLKKLILWSNQLLQATLLRLKTYGIFWRRRFTLEDNSWTENTRFIWRNTTVCKISNSTTFKSIFRTLRIYFLINIVFIMLSSLHYVWKIILNYAIMFFSVSETSRIILNLEDYLYFIKLLSYQKSYMHSFYNFYICEIFCTNVMNYISANSS